jgi:hypothetical protein
MSVRADRMFAISFAINLRPVAVILGLCPKAICNDRALVGRMFAIPTPDVCRSLQLLSKPIADAETGQRLRGSSVRLRERPVLSRPLTHPGRARSIPGAGVVAPRKECQDHCPHPLRHSRGYVPGAPW